jgi:hypothetical protein
VDARRAPKRVLNAHPSNQCAQLCLDLWPTSPSTRFPTPVTAKADPVPIMVRQPHATMQLATQDIQLVSKHSVLSFKPQLRLEWRAQGGQDETEYPDHSSSLDDSVASSTRIRFSVHTGNR